MKSSRSPKAHGPRSDCSRRPSHHTVVQETPTPMDSRVLHQRYALNLDGPLFRSQRELLQSLFDAACRQEPILLGSEETELLEGVLNLTDDLADQAADRYGIDCLLPTQNQEPSLT